MIERNGITLVRMNEVTECIGDDLHRMPEYLYEHNACVVASAKVNLDQIMAQVKAKGKGMAVIV